MVASALGNLAPREVQTIEVLVAGESPHVGLKRRHYWKLRMEASFAHAFRNGSEAFMMIHRGRFMNPPPDNN